MFARTRYLEWARRFYGKVHCDLATSGAASVPLSALGLPPPEALDDMSGWEQLRAAIARYNDVPAAEAIAALAPHQARSPLIVPADAAWGEAPRLVRFR